MSKSVAKLPKTLPKAEAIVSKKPILQDGLPMQAFAIIGDSDDLDTWQLPHHTKYLGVPGKGVEQTVDWPLADKAVLLISRYGIDGQRVLADPQLIINAAIHLAGHYRKAGLPIPNALCVYDTSGN